ncbi:MAG TPA: TolC family protein [Phycisphaerae bacterium]|nr:TolC family protein [Phycisphaerae bacterium]
MGIRRAAGVVVITCLLLPVGCRSLLVGATDRQVYRLVESRQQAALHDVHPPTLAPETGRVPRMPEAYHPAPHPIDSTLAGVELQPAVATPAELSGSRPATAAPVERQSAAEVPPAGEPADGSEPPAGEQPAAASGPAATATQEVNLDEVICEDPRLEGDGVALDAPAFTITDALAYAMRHARSLQNAKEQLYLAALDLSLERHLWTPQLVASLQTHYANYGQVRDFDHAMDAVSQFSVSQRLPYGGEVTATLVNNFMRDLGAHVTSGETGNVILSAGIPLLRGAGQAARESRYQAERELIYAVRTYEDFRRSFLVDLARDFFSLQESKAAVRNARENYKIRCADYQKAAFEKHLQVDRSVFDVSRARSSWRSAESSLVNAREQYATAVDRFKIRIGMPVDDPLTVVAQDEDEVSRSLETLLPRLPEAQAVELALQYRLDLLNSLDEVDDARRGVQVAKNRILPDLQLSGSATLNTDSNQLDSFSYHTDRVTWRSGLELRLDDRKSERNAYRAALIGLRRTERTHEEFADQVRSEVRRALRRLDQQAQVRDIQVLNVEENALRQEAAREQYRLGMISNRDLDEALNDLLQAQNALAGAVANYRAAVLEVLRDTGLLRVGEDGRWELPAALGVG